MRTYLSLLAAVGTLAFSGAVSGDENMRGTGATTRPTVPPGIQASQDQDTSQLRETLANVVSYVLNKNDVSKISGYIAQAKQNRLGDLSKLDNDRELNAVIDKIQKSWRDKYNIGFHATAEVFGENRLGNVAFVVGEITQPALLSNWPIQNKVGSDVRRDIRDGQIKGGNVADDNALKGMWVGIATFPESHGLPEVTCSFIKQDNTWKIEIPENIQFQTFRDSLVKP
jgi:hypothetical protein